MFISHSVDSKRTLQKSKDEDREGNRGRSGAWNGRGWEGRRQSVGTRSRSRVEPDTGRGKHYLSVIRLVSALVLRHGTTVSVNVRRQRPGVCVSLLKSVITSGVPVYQGPKIVTRVDSHPGPLRRKTKLFRSTRKSVLGSSLLLQGLRLWYHLFEPQTRVTVGSF